MPWVVQPRLWKKGVYYENAMCGPPCMTVSRLLAGLVWQNMCQKYIPWNAMVGIARGKVIQPSIKGRISRHYKWSLHVPAPLVPYVPWDISSTEWLLVLDKQDPQIILLPHIAHWLKTSTGNLKGVLVRQVAISIVRTLAFSKVWHHKIGFWNGS